MSLSSVQEAGSPRRSARKRTVSISKPICKARSKKTLLGADLKVDLGIDAFLKNLDDMESEERKEKLNNALLDVNREAEVDSRLETKLDDLFKEFQTKYSCFVRDTIQLKVCLIKLFGILNSYGIDIDNNIKNNMLFQADFFYDMPVQFIYETIKSNINHAAMPLAKKVECISALIKNLDDSLEVLDDSSSSSDEEGQKQTVDLSIYGGMAFSPGSFNSVLLGVEHCDLEN